MSDFLFNGYYGYRNVGDDVFCVIADWGSRKYWGARSLAFFAKELPKLSTAAKCIIPERKRFPGHGSVAAGLAGIAARRMVYFGGSTLHSAQDHWTRIFSSPGMRAALGKQIAAVGVSIGPFKSVAGEVAIRKLLRQMCFVSVRDQASLELLQNMQIGVPVVKAFDPAVLLLDVLADRSLGPVGAGPGADEGGGKVLGLSICRVESHVGGDLLVEQRRIETIKAVLRPLRASNVRFRFFEFNGHADSGDAPVTREVIASLDGYANIDVVPYNPDPLVVLDRIRACDAIFGVRLHAAILAYTAEVPFLLVEYHRKCADFLDEVGFAQAQRIGDADTAPHLIVERLRGMLFGQRPQASCRLGVSAARSLALQNFTAAPFLVGPGLQVAPQEFA